MADRRVVSLFTVPVPHRNGNGERKPRRPWRVELAIQATDLATGRTVPALWLVEIDPDETVRITAMREEPGEELTLTRRDVRQTIMRQVLGFIFHEAA